MPVDVSERILKREREQIKSICSSARFNGVEGICNADCPRKDELLSLGSCPANIEWLSNHSANKLGKQEAVY